MKVQCLLFTLFCLSFSYAQEKCLSYKVIQDQIANADNQQDVLDEIAALKNSTFVLSKSIATIKIPIVFHIIHNGDSLGENENLSDSLILEQLKRINLDLRAKNIDTSIIPLEFKPFLADTEIEFCLAKLDSNNNFTNGIIHHNFNKTGWDEDSINSFIKPQTIWDRNKFLNVWTFNFAGSLASGNVNGYATPPYVSTDSDKDGIVLNYTKVGNDLSNDIGRTLVHEIGHWFGLFHIWGDDNGACTGDDGIADTPNQGNSYQNCPSSIPNSCGSNDMYMNYMDYTDADCSLMFTQDQKTKMHAVLNGFRSSILNSDACNVKDLVFNEIVFPEGTVCQEYFIPAVIIKNIGSDTIYSYGFDFYLDNVLTASVLKTKILAPKEVVYAKSNEVFNVSLNDLHEVKFVIKTNDSNEYTLNNEKTTSFQTINTGSGIENGFVEDFENNNFPSFTLFLENEDNNITWEQYNGTTNKCLMINNFDNQKGSIDAVTTTDYNIFSSANNYVLKFDYLYKNRNGFEDKLNIYFSIDCGVHWFPFWQKKGADLSQNQMENSAFLYTNEEFQSAIIDLSNEFENWENIKKIRFRFENISDGGNNLYLDNINLEFNVPIVKLEAFDLKIFPNPTNDYIYIVQKNQKNLVIELLDLSGKVLLKEPLYKKETSISIKKFLSGLYFIKVSDKEKFMVQKVIKL